MSRKSSSTSHERKRRSSGSQLEQVTGDEQAREVDVGAPPRRGEDAHARRQVRDRAARARSRRRCRAGRAGRRDRGRAARRPARAARQSVVRRHPRAGRQLRRARARRRRADPRGRRAGDASDGSATYHAVVALGVGRELREQRRLAGSRGRDDEDEPVLLTRVAQRCETLSTERLGARRAGASAGWRVSLVHVGSGGSRPYRELVSCGAENRRVPFDITRWVRRRPRRSARSAPHRRARRRGKNASSSSRSPGRR